MLHATWDITGTTQIEKQVFQSCRRYFEEELVERFGSLPTGTTIMMARRC
jgi:hypothetical protein